MFAVANKMAYYTMSAVTIMVVLSKLLLYPKWKKNSVMIVEKSHKSAHVC